MKPIIRILLIAALMLAAALPARGRSRPVGVIMYPVSTQTAFAAPGGELRVWIAAEAEISSLRLARDAGAGIELEFEPTGRVDALDYELTARIPRDAPLGLWGLEADYQSPAGAGTDLQLRAVAVADPDADPVTIAHITDFHVGDPRSLLSTQRVGMSAARIRARVLESAAAERADLTLVTGDIASVPGNYSVEYDTAYAELDTGAAGPLLCVPGNHDLYAITPGRRGPGDGKDMWRRYLGRLHGFVDIGGFRLIFLNTYDWPDERRNFAMMHTMRDTGSYAGGAVSAEQLEDLRRYAAEADDAGKRIVLAGHHPPWGIHFRETVGHESLASREEFVQWLGAIPVELMLAGHNHAIVDRVWEGLRVVTTTTASSHLGDDSGWGYSVVTLSTEAEPGIRFVEVVPPAK